MLKMLKKLILTIALIYRFNNINNNSFFVLLFINISILNHLECQDNFSTKSCSQTCTDDTVSTIN